MLKLWEKVRKDPMPQHRCTSTLLVADTDGTSTRPKLSLAIKGELMKKKGLPVKKAIDPSVPRKTIVIDDPKPSADKRKLSKTKLRKSSSKSGHAVGIVDSVVTDNKRVHSQVLSKATNPQLSQMLSKATNAKLARLKTLKDQKAAAKRASPLKTTEKVAGHPASDKECSSILKKQKKSSANDAVEAKEMGDSSTVPSKSTKSK